MRERKIQEVRRQLQKILPKCFIKEDNGHVKVRIYEIEVLADYIISVYNIGYKEGKNRTESKFIKEEEELEEDVFFAEQADRAKEKSRYN